VCAVNLKCFFNKIKIVTCKPSGIVPRDGRLPGKHIMIRVVNCIVLQLELGVPKNFRKRGLGAQVVVAAALLEVDCNQITQATCFFSVVVPFSEPPASCIVALAGVAAVLMLLPCSCCSCCSCCCCCCHLFSAQSSMTKVRPVHAPSAVVDVVVTPTSAAFNPP